MASFLWVHGPPPMPQLDFGLWARIPQRFFPTLNPRSHFPYWSAVSHHSQRARHVHVTTCPLFSLSEPTILFSHWSAVSHSSDLRISSHFRFRWRHFRSCDFPLSPWSLWSVVSITRGNPTTNQKPRIKTRQSGPYGRTLLLLTSLVPILKVVESQMNRNTRKYLFLLANNIPSEFPNFQNHPSGEWKKGFFSFLLKIPLMGICKNLHHFLRSMLERGLSSNFIFFF